MTQQFELYVPKYMKVYNHIKIYIYMPILELSLVSKLENGSNGRQLTKRESIVFPLNRVLYQNKN